MEIIPLLSVERQSLSALLEDTLYSIEIKECNGIMAVTISADGETLVEGRRAAAMVPVIPEGPREIGNFVFSTMNDALPYWDQFGAGQQFLYLTAGEIEELRNA